MAHPFISAFLGRVAAALFIAVCIALGVGPDRWAEIIVGFPVVVAARIAFAILGIGTFIFVFGPAVKSGVAWVRRSLKPEYAGHPIGLKSFGWAVSGSSRNSLGKPTISAKNISNHEVQLKEITMVCGRTGTRLPTQIRTADNQWINATEAEAIPPHAEFQVQADLPRHNEPVDVHYGDHMYTLDEIARLWTRMYVHIECDDKKYDVALNDHIEEWLTHAVEWRRRMAPPAARPGIGRRT